jgi:hypothetical protein
MTVEGRAAVHRLFHGQQKYGKETITDGNTYKWSEKKRNRSWP